MAVLWCSPIVRGRTPACPLAPVIALPSLVRPAIASPSLVRPAIALPSLVRPAIATTLPRRHAAP